MGKKRKKRIILSVILFLFIIAAGVAILIASAVKPPLETINLARENLGKAHNAEAEEYASKLLTEAESAWQEAMEEWENQNKKWFLSRNFTHLNELSQLTAKKAEEAYQHATARKGTFHKNLAATLQYIAEKVKSYEKKYASLPPNQQSRAEYSNAKILYLESKQAYERGNYTNAESKLIESRTLIEKAISKSHSILEGYFKDLSKWTRWSDETIEWSSSKSSTAILVDKFARKCYVYRNGSLKRTFNIELGPNWIGAKLHLGDKATPEGKYHITKKKKSRATKYHKALLINYPNNEDKARYENAVTNGRISRNTGIGSLIEIHGDGGRGMDWTNGCIALENKDMDVVYKMVSVGTPVTIVGSLRSLNEINNY